jgi:hypothetical protein
MYSMDSDQEITNEMISQLFMARPKPSVSGFEAHKSLVDLISPAVVEQTRPLHTVGSDPDRA